jgi:hypothetical protein
MEIVISAKSTGIRGLIKELSMSILFKDDDLNGNFYNEFLSNCYLVILYVGIH